MGEEEGRGTKEEGSPHHHQQFTRIAGAAAMMAPMVILRSRSVLMDAAALMGVMCAHRAVMGLLRRLEARGKVAQGSDERGEAADGEEEMEFESALWPAMEDARGSVEVLGSDAVERSKRQQQQQQQQSSASDADSRGINNGDGRDARSGSNARSANPYTGLKDGCVVCLCSAGGGHFLGVGESNGGGDNTYELEIVVYNSGSSVSSVEWLDGAVRLPTVPSECTFTVTRRADDVFAFSSCRANGRFIKAVKNADGKHAIGGHAIGKQELWRVGAHGKLFNAAFPGISLGWEPLELKATPVSALRESERMQLREVRKMRTQVQSSELRIRESDRKKRDSVAEVQQEAEVLQARCDKQECRIDELQGSLMHTKQQLHASQTSCAELDRLVVQLAGEKQQAVQSAQLEQQEEMNRLRRELTDTRKTLEARIGGLLSEKRALEGRNEEVLELNTAREAELLELQQERIRLNATLKDVADKVLGSVSPVSDARSGYVDAKFGPLDSSPSFRDMDGFHENEAPDVDVTRTYAGGRRIGVGGPRGRLF